jgi:predicted nucleic acid-binding protein
MSGRAFFDTNVLVYLFDEDSPRKQARAKELFAKHADDGPIVLSPQVLQEFYVTVTRKLARPLSPEDALSAVSDLSHFPVVAVDGATVLEAVRLHQSERLSFWDALIVEAALEADCSTLFSEDLQGGRRFGNLRIENPFV